MSKAELSHKEIAVAKELWRTTKTTCIASMKDECWPDKYGTEGMVRIYDLDDWLAYLNHCYHEFGSVPSGV